MSGRQSTNLAMPSTPMHPRISAQASVSFNLPRIEPSRILSTADSRPSPQPRLARITSAASLQKIRRHPSVSGPHSFHSRCDATLSAYRYSMRHLKRHTLLHQLSQTSASLLSKLSHDPSCTNTGRFRRRRSVLRNSPDSSMARDASFAPNETRLPAAFDMLRIPDT